MKNKRYGNCMLWKMHLMEIVVIENARYGNYRSWKMSVIKLIRREKCTLWKMLVTEIALFGRYLLVFRENSTGKRELRRATNQTQGAVQIAVLVHVNRKNGSKYFLSHDLVTRIFRHDNRRFDEISTTAKECEGTNEKKYITYKKSRRPNRQKVQLPVVALPAADDLQIARVLGVSDVLGDPLERLRVDHGGSEVRVVSRIADLQLVTLAQQALLYLE